MSLKHTCFLEFELLQHNRQILYIQIWIYFNNFFLIFNIKGKNIFEFLNILRIGSNWCIELGRF